MKTVRLYMLPDYQPREHTSCSRVEMHLRCERMIGFKSLMGVRPEEGYAPWLDLGKDIHGHLQGYAQGYQIDTTEESGRRALSCLHLLPDFRYLQKTDVEVEASINIQTPSLWPNLEPIQILGNRDLAFKGIDYWNLVDYKTTRGNKKTGQRDPWGYMITPEKLLNNVQGNWYALDLMLNKGQTRVPARWVTILTDLEKHPDARATDVVFEYGDVVTKSRQFLEVSDRFRELVRYWRKAPFDINSLKANTDQCEEYGGCPYRAANGGPCNARRSLGAMFMTQSNGQPNVEDMLAQRAQQQGYQQPGAYPPPPPPPGPPQGPPPGMPGIPQGYGAPPQGQPMPPPQGYGGPPGPPQGYGGPPGPPQAQQWGPPPQPGGMGYQPPQAPHLPPEAQQQWQPPPPPQHPGVAGQGAPQLPPPAAPAKRGRKPKAVVPATQGADEETVEERAAFMRLFVCEHFRGLALNTDPNAVPQLVRNACSAANQAWIALTEAGA